MKVCFYNVDVTYIEFLKKYENERKGYTRVPNVQYKSGNNKFFYGTVLNIEGINYFVPISSKQHNKQDDLPIRTKDKYKKELSTLRFAYMIPIPNSCLSYLNINSETNKTRQETLRKELAFCRRNRDKIFRQAKKTYDRVVNKVSVELTRNACDFKLLEQAYNEYVANLPYYYRVTAKGVEQLQKNGINVEVRPSSNQKCTFIVSVQNNDRQAVGQILNNLDNRNNLIK